MSSLMPPEFERAENNAFAKAFTVSRRTSIHWEVGINVDIFEKVWEEVVIELATDDEPCFRWCSFEETLRLAAHRLWHVGKFVQVQDD